MMVGEGGKRGSRWYVLSLSIPARGNCRWPISEIWGEREAICSVKSFLRWLPEIWYISHLA